MTISSQSFPSSRPLSYQDELRPLLQTGDLLLCSGTGLFSELIRQATDSPWSHVGLIVRVDAIDRVMLMESVETHGVRTLPLSRYLLDYDQEGNPYPGGLAVVRHRRFAQQCGATHIQAMLQFAVDQFGSAYDRKDLVRIAARVLSAHLKPSALLAKDSPPQRAFICSEYVAQCYARAGVVLEPQAHHYVTPADFAHPSDVELLGVMKAQQQAFSHSYNAPVLPTHL